MRFLRTIVALAALGLLTFVPAANALTITATAPTAPLPYDGTTTIDVTITTACSEVVQDQTETQTLTAASSVDWIEAAGSSVPWTSEQCDPNSASGATTCTPQPECVDDYPIATTTGTITLTPTNIAPALETAEITLTLGEKEGSFTFPVTVSHYVSLNATTDRPKVPAALADKQPFNITLDVNTNAVGHAQFTLVQAPKQGTIRGLDNVPVTPNIATLFEHHAGFFVWSDGGPDAGKPVSLKVPLQYESPATVWAADSATIEVVMVAEKDPTLMSEPITLTWTFEPTVTEVPKEDSPAPGLLVFVIVLGLALFANHRRSRA